MMIMRLVVAGVCIACGVAVAAPKNDAARDKYKAAQKLAADDDNEAALALVDQGLALVATNLELLQLRGTLLLKTRDYAGALVAYQAYLDAGAQGANRREAIKILGSLRPVKTTFVDLTANTNATIFLDTRTAGVFCTAPCKKALLPGDYKVIAERPGFDKWTGRLTVESGKTVPFAVVLVEKPSSVVFHVTPAGAAIAIDGKPFDAAILPAGKHEAVLKLANHATRVIAVTAHEGQPVEVTADLDPLIPIEIAPATATLVVDDKPAVLQDGGVAVGPGAHVLIAKAPGFHDQKIEIQVSRPAKLAVKLTEVGTLVDIAGAPSGARVQVDGKTVATMPSSAPIEIAPGKHTVEIKLSGYRPYTTTGAFGSDQHARLHLGKLRRDDRRRTRWAGIGTGTFLVGGSVFSLLAVGKQSDYDKRAKLAGIGRDDPGLHDLKSSGQRYSLFADIGFGLAIGGIGLTTYLFTHEGRGESEGSLRIGVGVVSGTAGAVASGRF